METLYYLTDVYSPKEKAKEDEEEGKEASERDDQDDIPDDLKRLEELKILMFLSNESLDLGDNMNVSIYISILIRVAARLRNSLARPL